MSDRRPADAVFSDPLRAARQLGQLHESFLSSGSEYPLSRFTDLLDGFLQGASDPDLCLNTLVRCSESTVSRSSLFNDLLRYPVMADLFRALAGSSAYISDILVRDPSLFRWLATTDALGHAVTAEEFVSETERLRDLFPRPERRLEALKRYHRREFLRIGSRDLLDLAGLQETTRQLSLLADATIGAVHRLSAEQVGS
jgi:glutamate-ammonia-ligase adenylyltransferase